MLPTLYQNHFQKHLKKSESLTLELLIGLVQTHKQVSVEQLATLMPYPIKFESRRRNIQRFLKLDSLQIESLWFPLLKIIIEQKLKPKSPLKITLDRTQWRDKNVLMVSLIWNKRAIPVYWQLLNKRGSSNLSEQQSVLTPVFEMFKDYQIIVLGDREFGSVKLAQWLCSQDVQFALRIKQQQYIQTEKSDYIRLSQLGLVPGTRFFLKDVQVTKQKGFGQFNVAAYWRRNYRGHGEDEGWYLLTNLGSLSAAIAAFKCRSGIEALFKDCKTGGYNLEKTHACPQRLITLILVIALAYTWATLQGHRIKWMRLQQYVGRLKEFHRRFRRHSSFWVGLYGQAWVVGMDFFREIVGQLMQIRRNKLPFFQQGLRAMSLIVRIF